MAEPGVEREMRETRLPVGGLVLRGLVVAGFASGVWLLSGSAAHAAEGGHQAGGHATDHVIRHRTESGPVAQLITGLGRMLGLGSTGGAGAGNGGATRVGGAGTGTSGAGGTAGPATAFQHHPASTHVAASDLLSRVLTPASAGTVVHPATAGRTDAASGSTMAGSLVAGPVPGPVRADSPGGGVLGTLLTGVPAGLFDRVLGAPGGTLDPMTDTLVRTTGTVADAAMRHTRSLLSRLTHRRALPGAVAGPRRLAPLVRTSAGGIGTSAAAHPAGGLLGHARPAVAERHAVHEGTVRIGTAYRPILPRPAPVPASPGPGSMGLPTSAPVSQVHGGTPAVLTTAVVTAPAALRRLSASAQVEARRLVVESPTVSPD